MVSLGGNIQVKGSKPDGTSWKVAVEDPFSDSENAYAGILSVADKAVVTSGTYERYFEKDGKRYHHILDPATGYPAEKGLASVTIVSDDGTGRCIVNGTVCYGERKSCCVLESTCKGV